MNRFQTRCQFTEYLLKQLGSPLLDIVVEYDTAIGAGGFGTDCDTPSASGTTGTSGTSAVGTTGTSGTSGYPQIACAVKSQLDYVIDDAVDYFREYASETGNEKGVLFLQLEHGVQSYTLPDTSDIVAVLQPLRDGHARGMGFEFDSEEGQASVGLFSFSSTFGARGIYSHMGGGSYDNILTYEIAAEYMSLIDMRYSRKFQINHNRLSNTINVFPTPTKTDHGRTIACEMYQRVSEEKAFNHPWMRRYATALLKVQVGRNTSMYDGIQFPGGGSYNSAFYYNEGKEERDKLEEELMTGKWGNIPSSAIFTTG